MISYIFLALLFLFETDLFIGLLHLTFDNETHIDKPFISIPVKDFILHHKSPTTINNNRLATYLNIIPLYTYLLIPHFIFNCNAYVYIIMSLLGLLGNYTHNLCHEKNKSDIPIVIKKLMDCRILMSRKQHAEHHSTFDKNFGLLNGWSNFLTNRLYKINYFRSHDYLIFFMYTTVRLVFLTYIFNQILNI